MGASATAVSTYMNRLDTTTPSTKPAKSSILQNAWYHPTNSHPEGMPVSSAAATCSTTASVLEPAEKGMSSVPMPAHAANAQTVRLSSRSRSLRRENSKQGTRLTTQTTSDSSYTNTDALSGNSCGAKKQRESHSWQSA